MPNQGSAVSFSHIRNVLGLSGSVSLSNSNARSLFGKPTAGSTIQLSHGQGKTNYPSWSTAAGTLGTYFSTYGLSKTVAAVPQVNGTINYTTISGSSPGLTYSGNTVQGTPSISDFTSQTYNWTVRATNAANGSYVDRTFSVTVQSKYVGYVCGQVGEGSTLSLTAPSGNFNRVDFASYGTATGSCGGYATSGCHSTSTGSVVSSAFLGRTSGSVGATNDIFGDPCGGTFKSLTVQLSYGG